MKFQTALDAPDIYTLRYNSLILHDIFQRLKTIAWPRKRLVTCLGYEILSSMKRKPVDILSSIIEFHTFTRGVYAFDSTLTLIPRLFEYGTGTTKQTKHVAAQFHHNQMHRERYCVDFVHIWSLWLVRKMTHGVVSKSTHSRTVLGS